MVESACLKIEKIKAKGYHGGVDLEVRKKALQVYIYESLDICRKAAKDALQSFDSGSEKKWLKRAVNLLLPEYDINVKEYRRDIANYIYEKGEYTL
jgi:hypothetical protein